MDEIYGRLVGKRRYTVSKLSAIRSAIAGYAGGAAIARELIQNADDAKAAWIELYVDSASLVVKNGSLFSDRDFDAICDIASGSKRDDEESTGTWGTGFLSVYQLTDYPDLRSGGRRIIFDPTKDELDEWESPVIGHTEFHFPWRTEYTEIARSIEADPWMPERIQLFEAELGREIYRALIFLRTVTRISVYHGLGQPVLLFEVKRDLSREESLETDAVREHWDFTIHDYQHGTRKDEWVFYRGALDRGFVRESDDKVIKGPNIAFAYGPEHPWLMGEMPGTLFNFLPTDIRTGFPFHINGDFFPDANRRTILTDTSVKADWNRRVIEGIGQLFSLHLEPLRDDCPTPDAFYRLLPVSHDQNSQFLEPIIRQFRSRAKDAEIVNATGGSWFAPGKVVLPEDEGLRRLTESYFNNIAPENLPDHVAQLMAELGMPGFTVEAFLTTLKKYIPDGTEMERARSFLNSREKLDAVLSYVGIRLEGALGAEAQRIDSALNGAPLALDSSGGLRTLEPTTVFLADNELRVLLPPEAYPFVDANFQVQHHAVLKRKLRSLDANDLVAYLKTIAQDCDGQHLADAHASINSWEKLRSIYDYLTKHMSDLKTPETTLTDVVICPDETGVLHRLGSAVYLADAELRRLLRGAGVLFVSQDIQGVPAYVQFLETAGVPRLTPSRLVRLLEQFFPTRQLRQNANATLNSVDQLRALYRFFHEHAADLHEDDRTRLRQLPFVLTQQDNLAAIANHEVPLSLLPLTVEGDDSRFTDVLKLDNLISGRVTDDDLRAFFQRTLGVQPLTAISYIHDYLVRHYERADLDHAARLQLLRLVRDRLPQLKEPRNKDTLAKLRSVCLIRCGDDQYRTANEMYFPSVFLDRIFPEGYPTLHPEYDIAKDEGSRARRGERSRPVYEESAWYELCSALDMRTQPAAGDLIASVRRTVAAPVSSPAIDHVRGVYELLDDGWSATYSDSQEDLTPLRDLRWLPADGDATRWYQPRELYPIGLRALIRSQAKLLPFRQARADFSSFLGLNIQARVIDVVNHLLWLSREGQPAEGGIYQFLNQRRDAPEIDRLIGQPVIYDRVHGRYWRPDQVYLGNYYEDFGPYRFYVTGDLGDDWLGLFKKLEVRDRVASPDDYAAILEEIAEAHRGETVEREEQRLLNRAYVQLAVALEEREYDDEKPIWMEHLSTLPVVLDQDLQLVEPVQVFFNDRPDLLGKFPPGTVRIARYAEERARPFLIALGVRPLSEVVHRSSHHISDARIDQVNGVRLKALARPFRRIVETYRRSVSTGWEDADVLATTEIWIAEHIEVRYVLDALHPRLDGAVEAQEAFFDRTNRRLYLSASVGTLSGNRVLAREVCRILNPSLEPALLMASVAALLNVRQLSEADATLDAFDMVHLDVRREDLQIDTELQSAAQTQIGLHELAGTDTEPWLDGGERQGTAADWISDQSPSADEESNQRFGLSGGAIPDLSGVPVDAPGAGQGQETRVGDTSGSPSEQVSNSVLPPQQTAQLNAVGGGARSSSGQTSTPDTPVLQAPGDVAVPSFAGATRPQVPIIPTDYAALRERYGIPGGQSARLEDLETAIQQEDAAEDTPDDQQQRVDEVRFILSFMNRYEGFLPLTRAAVLLLRGQTRTIECATDFSDRFPLYIDRTRNVIYNQEDLPRFFAAHDIPAGGIVYLRRQHGTTFRMYYKEHPHIITNVRLAELGEDGEVHYTVVPEMEVRCEISDLVFRADKRLEDRPALFREAIDKKSVFQTLCDIFAATRGQRLHHEELFNILSTIRMVSYYAVQTELRQRPCFVDEGAGFWSFDPSRVEEQSIPRTGRKEAERPSPGWSGSQPRTQGYGSTSQGGSAPVMDEPSALPSRSTTASEPSLLGATSSEGNEAPPASDRLRVGPDVAQILERDLTTIRERLQSLTPEPVQLQLVLRRWRTQFISFVGDVEQLYRRLALSEQGEPVSPSDDHAGNMVLDTATVLLARLREDPTDEAIVQQFVVLLRELVEQATGGAAQDTLLSTVLGVADPGTWDLHILPLLDGTAKRCAEQRQFPLARMFYQLIERYTGQSRRAMIETINAQEQASEFLSLCDGSGPIEEELQYLREAIQLDPSLSEARSRYNANVQALITPRLASALEQVARGPAKHATQSVDLAKYVLESHTAFLTDQRSLREEIDRTYEHILEVVLDQARGAVERDDPAPALDHYLAAAYIYLSITSARVRNDHASDYLEALEEIGNGYRITERHTEAIIAFTRAVDFWQQEATGGTGHAQLVTIRSRLAESYEYSGLWDWGFNVRKRVVETCPNALREREQEKLDFADRRRREQRTSLASSHRSLLQALKKCQSNSELVAAVTSTHIGGLLQREQDSLNGRT